MASGDMTDGKCETHDGDSECECDGEDSRYISFVVSQLYPCADSTESTEIDENCGSAKFNEGVFDQLLPIGTVVRGRIID